jgi:IclR family acetate operon transcriptional repressor
MPAYASASGRALLAELSPARIREFYPQGRLRALTERTIATRRKLEAELEATRRRGYAVQRGELEADVAAIAAAVRDSRGQASFSITVAVPTFRLTERDIARIGDAVVKCASDLSSALPT